MRVHGNCRRLTAVLLSLTLLCGIAAHPATAASVGEVVRAGIPENAVPGDIRITTYAVPNEAQMAGLREDAAQKTPDGFVFYGWYVTGEEGSFAIADSGLENWLCEIYADVAQDEDCRLVLQYLYIPAEERHASTTVTGTDSFHFPSTNGRDSPMGKNSRTFISIDRYSSGCSLASRKF